MKLLLVHGGLWENMTADRFWRAPGVTDGLIAAGYDCIAPDRIRQPATWRDDTDHLIRHTPDEPFAIIAASNAVTSAIQTAIATADRVTGLLLAWPATQGDPRVDTLAQHLPHCDILPTFPETPCPEFPATCGHFLTTVTDWLATTRAHT